MGEKNSIFLNEKSAHDMWAGSQHCPANRLFLLPSEKYSCLGKLRMGSRFEQYPVST